MCADWRSADRVGMDSVLIEKIEHRMCGDKSALGVESCGLAIEVVVALLPGRKLHLPPHDGFSLQHIFESLFVVAGQIYSPRSDLDGDTTTISFGMRGSALTLPETIC